MSQTRLYVELRFPNVVKLAILSYNVAILVSFSFTTYYFIELCFIIMKLKLRPLWAKTQAICRKFSQR